MVLRPSAAIPVMAVSVMATAICREKSARVLVARRLGVKFDSLHDP
jgi:hypothetical protein